MARRWRACSAQRPIASHRSGAHRPPSGPPLRRPRCRPAARSAGRRFAAHRGGAASAGPARPATAPRRASTAAPAGPAPPPRASSSARRPARRRRGRRRRAAAVTSSSRAAMVGSPRLRRSQRSTAPPRSRPRAFLGLGGHGVGQRARVPDPPAGQFQRALPAAGRPRRHPARPCRGRVGQQQWAAGGARGPRPACRAPGRRSPAAGVPRPPGRRSCPAPACAA